MRTPSLNHRQSGFTLIEIMVVVIIIGVMSVAVVSSLTGNNDREARLQASRFMAVVDEVRDEAIIAGDNFFLIVDDKAGSYRFESVRSQASSAGDSLFKSRLVGEKVELDWEVFEVLDDGESSQNVLISSLGEITPFEARFEGTELSYVVVINEEGQLERLDKKGVKF